MSEGSVRLSISSLVAFTDGIRSGRLRQCSQLTLLRILSGTAQAKDYAMNTDTTVGY